MVNLFHRYFFEISFNGEKYHGWQRQLNALSIQEILEDKFEIIFKTKCSIVGCGRTDTGVHASQYFFHFDSNQLISQKSIFSLNALLPKDIIIKQCFEVNPNAHARFSALQRTYEYNISFIHDPFSYNFSSYMKYKLKVDLMNKACETLINYTDFASFCKANHNHENTVCEIYNAFFNSKDSNLKFTISANRFLRNMVRAIVGTLIDIGKEKISLDDFKKIIENKDRRLAGMSVPAQGLFLTKVIYPSDIKKG